MSNASRVGWVGFGAALGGFGCIAVRRIRLLVTEALSDPAGHATARSHEDHFAYEIRALCRSARRYRDEVPAADKATPPHYPDAVFFLEASLMHGRNLLEFLKKGRWVMKPADVGITALPTNVDALFTASYGDGKTIEKAYGGLCAFIDHLSPKRVSYGPEWVIHDPVRLAKSLLDVLDVVFAGHPDDGRIAQALADGRADLPAA
jgi:hypothetical protein